jgi:hypothetical protein
MGKRGLQSNPSVGEFKKRVGNLLPTEDGGNTRLGMRMLLGRQIVRWNDRYVCMYIHTGTDDGG